jgi:hypothetical protein
MVLRCTRARPGVWSVRTARRRSRRHFRLTTVPHATAETRSESAWGADRWPVRALAGGPTVGGRVRRPDRRPTPEPPNICRPVLDKSAARPILTQCPGAALPRGDGQVRKTPLWQLGGTHPAGAANGAGVMLAGVKPAAAPHEQRMPLRLHDGTGSRKEVIDEAHQQEVPNGDEARPVLASQAADTTTSDTQGGYQWPDSASKRFATSATRGPRG